MQVERQQPVYFLDALGRVTPFHLEFIRSAEVNAIQILRLIGTKPFLQGLYSGAESQFPRVHPGQRDDSEGRFRNL